MINSLKRSLILINNFAKTKSFVTLPNDAVLPLTPTSASDRKLFLHWLFSKNPAPVPLVDLLLQDLPESVDALLDQLLHLHAIISICCIAEILDTIKDCRIHLATCQRSLQKNQTPFLQNLLYNIKSNYAPLFRKDFDLIQLLLWCKEKGFIQQAFTIAADHLPLYLANKKLFQVDDQIQRLCSTLHVQHS